MIPTPFTSDLCIKCNICTSACPVAAVTDLFPGPKAVGPQAQRFRHPRLAPVDRSVDYCSGCGVCSLVCPHGVQVAEMNAIARSAMFEASGLPLRNRLLGRAERLGQIGSPFAPLSNLPLRIPPLRWLVEKFLGIHRKAPFPPFARPNFRAWFRGKGARPPALGYYKVVYFHGCSTNYYEPRIGKAAVAILERNRCRVTVAEQNCCGLPMQSNGDFESARAL
ncbi:MAG: 4Fe-4S dicluster domain-containing protein, partial [Chloroflexi bacterium]|nr:4Fe-4S dicluster domain-containing protein [Chloroflexota bacterium]